VGYLAATQAAEAGHRILRQLKAAGIDATFQNFFPFRHSGKLQPEQLIRQ
jgi:hypothetical protein